MPAKLRGGRSRQIVLLLRRTWRDRRRSCQDRRHCVIDKSGDGEEEERSGKEVKRNEGEQGKGLVS